eukprot:g811.t1
MLPTVTLNRTKSSTRRGNLVALKQLNRKISKILGTTKYVVLYSYDTRKCGWKRDNVEGPLFVVQHERGKYGLCILNQKSPQDWMMTVNANIDYERNGDFIFLRQNESRGRNKKITRCIWFRREEELQHIAQIIELTRETSRKREKPPAKKLIGIIDAALANSDSKHAADKSSERKPKATSSSSSPVISRKALRDTLLELLHDDEFFGKIYDAYTKRVGI